MPRWKRSEGADFVFYDPHPGFATGRAEMPVIDMICNTFRHSMHIIAERSQRNVCQTYWTMADKLLIVPYVPGTSDVAKPLKVLQSAQLLTVSQASSLSKQLAPDLQGHCGLEATL